MDLVSKMASRSPGQLPLSRHPLFPMVVGLWFSALLGLGSLALRASLLERLALALHLDLVIPAAALPLGLTTRMLLALVLAVGGGLVGLILARRLGQAVPQRRARKVAPIVVAAAAAARGDDDEDLARLEAARAAHPRRRRSLTAGDEMAPPTPLDPAPLPGTHTGNPGPRILTFGDLEPIPPLGTATGDRPEPVDEPGIARAAPQPVAQAAATASTPALAPALAPAPERRPAPPPALAPLPLAASAPVEGSAARRLREAPLATLGVVELVERFALALDARRARIAANAAPAASVADGTALTEPAPGAAGQVAAELHEPVRPFDIPAVLRTRGVDRAAGDESGAGLPEDEFSSLLDMKPSIRPPIPLADEHRAESIHPVVVFPGRGMNGIADLCAPAAPLGTSPAATEHALREALATLQRMSGAA